MPNLVVVRWMRAAKGSFSHPMGGEILVEEPGCRHIALGGIPSGRKQSNTYKEERAHQAYLNSRTCPTFGVPDEERRDACIVSVIVEADADTGSAK